MNGAATFRHILKQKMEGELSLSAPPTEAFGAFHSPLSPELLTLRFTPLRWEKKTFYSPPPPQKKPETQTTEGPQPPPEPVKMEPSWPREALTPEEQQALKILKFEFARVTLPGIKRAWRQQALRLHPDRQGMGKTCGLQFQLAREAYQKLCEALKRLSQEDSLR